MQGGGEGGEARGGGREHRACSHVGFQSVKQRQNERVRSESL